VLRDRGRRRRRRVDAQHDPDLRPRRELAPRDGFARPLTARSHVWLEEFFAGDHGNDPERDIIAPLHRAQRLCIALQFGGTTPMGRVEAVQPAKPPARRQASAASCALCCR
jgi:hypothetical protein